ncbi:carcinoembryonic antigen-related cell adhesion molecule 18-like, partial [Rhineura floridana]|uniref:carcinoembryonic antigen-related cell adhesion molecule 18-like n=1 Tax=Rhineura floridana TaxID=261503 RepID=UPI002AC83914
CLSLFSLPRTPPCPAPAYFLASHFLFTEANRNFSILITVQPWFPSIGTEVSLFPEPSKERTDVCSWYRWDTSNENQILVYQPPPRTKMQHTSSYTGRESVRPDCSLHIRNISVMDITYYIIERNTTNSSEVGQVFLVVVEKGSKQENSRHLSGGAIAGIFVACLAGSVFLVALISYTNFKGSVGPVENEVELVELYQALSLQEAQTFCARFFKK